MGFPFESQIIRPDESFSGESLAIRGECPRPALEDRLAAREPGQAVEDLKRRRVVRRDLPASENSRDLGCTVVGEAPAVLGFAGWAELLDGAELIEVVRCRRASVQLDRRRGRAGLTGAAADGA